MGHIYTEKASLTGCSQYLVNIIIGKGADQCFLLASVGSSTSVFRIWCTLSIFFSALQCWLPYYAVTVLFYVHFSSFRYCRILNWNLWSFFWTSSAPFLHQAELGCMLSCIILGYWSESQLAWFLKCWSWVCWIYTISQACRALFIVLLLLSPAFFLVVYIKCFLLRAVCEPQLGAWASP